MSTVLIANTLNLNCVAKKAKLFNYCTLKDSHS